MIEEALVFLHQYVVPLGAVGVFFAAFIENVIAPIPSAIVLYTAGFIFLTDLSGLSYFWVLILTIALPAALGITLGSFLLYGIGYWAGKPFFERWGKWVGISWQEIIRIHDKFSKNINDEVALGIMRAIPIFPNVALSAAAGVVRMRPLGFGIASFLGSIPRAIILAVIGSQAGVFYGEYNTFFDRFENHLLIAFVGIIILGILFRNWRRRNISVSRDKI